MAGGVQHDGGHEFEELKSAFFIRPADEHLARMVQLAMDACLQPSRDLAELHTKLSMWEALRDEGATDIESRLVRSICKDVRAIGGLR